MPSLLVTLVPAPGSHSWPVGTGPIEAFALAPGSHSWPVGTGPIEAFALAAAPGPPRLDEK